MSYLYKLVAIAIFILAIAGVIHSMKVEDILSNSDSVLSALTDGLSGMYGVAKEGATFVSVLKKSPFSAGQKWILGFALAGFIFLKALCYAMCIYLASSFSEGFSIPGLLLRGIFAPFIFLSHRLPFLGVAGAIIGGIVFIVFVFTIFIAASKEYEATISAVFAVIFGFCLFCKKWRNIQQKMKNDYGDNESILSNLLTYGLFLIIIPIAGSIIFVVIDGYLSKTAQEMVIFAAKGLTGRL
jgi:hypothetical protein